MSRTILFIAASLLLSQTGCVHRRVTINSNPAGALVRIDGKDIDGYPPDNGVHPNPVGYQQIGTSIYSWLKWRLASE